MAELQTTDNQTSVERVTEMLFLNKHDLPEQSFYNMRTALTYDDTFRGRVLLNRMSEKIELHIAAWNRSDYDLSLTDSDLVQIRAKMEDEYGLKNHKDIYPALQYIANDHTYHPIVQKLESLEWDGQPHIERLLPKYLGVEQCRMTTEIFKYFLLGAICRVIRPGCKFDEMLCFVDPTQGAGKSTMCRCLAMNDMWFSDDFKKMSDENAYRWLQGHWLIECPEMNDITRAKEAETLKAFLSRPKDIYKKPYDILPQDHPRQCVFIGTTNNIDCLPDDKSGNRRFLPLLCNKYKAEVHPLANVKQTRADAEQCWAEAMHIYNSLPKDEYGCIEELKLPDDVSKDLELMRKGFEQEDSRIGLIQEFLDTYKGDYVCSVMIYDEIYNDNESIHQKPKKSDLRAIGSIMNNKVEGWSRYLTESGNIGQYRFDKYGQQRAWKRNPKNGEICQPTLSTNDFQPVNGSLTNVPF